MSNPIRTSDGGAVGIALGQYVVVNGTWRYETGKVLRMTAQYLWYSKEYRAGGQRGAKDRVVFCGAEDTAKSLLEKLTSSCALHDQERHAATARMEKRNAALIAAARSSQGK